MTVKEQIIASDMILVVYDFRDTPEGNAERNKLRIQLTSAPFHAKMMNQSVYYLSATIASLEAVRKWARSTEADIKVFGNVDATIRDRQRLANDYLAHLHDTVKEVDEIVHERFKELQKFEDTLDDEDASIRGWTKKINGAKSRFDEIRKLVSRFGSDRDEFQLEKLATFVKMLEKRYERVQEAWEQRKK